ncbi:hypothetical protein Scep_022739 [Stephania cephalantha]|uniref:Uncharacterized protein n=1 Tax=Stephania cephalantha TaxID=152367 RepID=A0AAP0F602_9MAGN
MFHFLSVLLLLRYQVAVLFWVSELAELSSRAHVLLFSHPCEGAARMRYQKPQAGTGIKY